MAGDDQGRDREPGRRAGGGPLRAGGLLSLLEQGVCLTVRELALSGGDMVKAKIELSGTATARPRVRNIRMLAVK